jgi:hypothetical protein
MQYNEFHQVYTCVTGHLWLSDVFQDKHILAGGCGMTRPTGDKMAPILSLAGRVILTTNCVILPQGGSVRQSKYDVMFVHRYL